MPPRLLFETGLFRDRNRRCTIEITTRSPDEVEDTCIERIRVVKRGRLVQTGLGQLKSLRRILMEFVGSFEAKTHLAQLLDRVAQGEEFIITKHGKPVARLVPVTATMPKPDVRQVIEELKVFSKGNTFGEGNTIRDLIEEGRRF
jgi:prevent-host-death family protein